MGMTNIVKVVVGTVLLILTCLTAAFLALRWGGDRPVQNAINTRTAPTVSYSISVINRDGGFDCHFEKSDVQGGEEKICTGLIANMIESA